MRRFVGYLLLAGATLLGVGAAAVPTALKMDADMNYAAGRTLYFRAAEWDDATLNGNYTGADGSTLDYDPTLTTQPIAYIADTMRDRLDAYGLTGYKVETKGSDIVAVTVRPDDDNATIYTYLEKYLTFSGGDYEIDATDVSGEGYAYQANWSDIIDDQTAYIEYMDTGSYKVPTVIVPLKSGDDYKKSFLDLVQYCKDNTVEEDEENNVTAKTVNVVIWSNRSESDSYDQVMTNPNIANKIVAQVAPDNATYYADDDEDQEKPSLRIIPTSSATSSHTYDAGQTKAAYDAARDLVLRLNAGSFTYDELKSSSAAAAPKYAISYLYSDRVVASVESLIANGDWTQNIALSATFIAIAIAVVITIVVLCFFERALAALEVAATSIAVFATFATYVAMGLPFTLPALLGFVATGLASLFGMLYFSAKLREELYKGRTVKKANSEAAKRALLPNFDIAFIAILIGACVYGLAGDVASKFGVVLILGGFFAFVGNFLYTRIGGWLLCNDITISNNPDKAFGVKKDLIPDTTKLEKPSYFGPYADRNFSKGKIVSLVFSSLMLLAGIGATVAWGVINSGNSFFNTSNYESSAPVLRIDVRSNQADTITLANLRETSDLIDATFVDGEAPSDIFHNYKINGVYLADYVSELSLSDESKLVYIGEGNEGVSYYWFYYEATLGKNSASILDSIKDDSKTLTITKWNGASYSEIAGNTLSDLSSDIINEFVGGTVETTYSGAYTDVISVGFVSVTPENLTPYLWQVALGLGIGEAVVMVYLCLRYRPSRGLAAGVFAGGAATIGTTFFILTRIATLPIVSLGSGLGLIVISGLQIFVLGGEKEIARDSKEKEKKTLEFKAMTISAATSRQAHNVFLFALIAAFVMTSFLFGPTVYANVFLNAILTFVFGLALLMTALPFCSGILAKLFGKIKFRPIKRKKKTKQGGQLLKKNKSAEPEESIFIGIND